MFWFGIWSAFSGQTIYEAFIYQLYNIFPTSVPIMYYSVMIFQYDKDEYLKNPKLYKIGISAECFSTKTFWRWLIYGSL